MAIGNGKTSNGDSKNPTEDKKLYKFLFVSWESLSGDLAWQIQKEDHEVKIYIKDVMDEYEGFLERVEDWKAWVDWADVIIFDDIWFGEEADNLRKAGKFVVGGSVYADDLEDNREFGQSEMKAAGISVPPSWNFNDYDEALKFIKENPGRYVYKPSGNVLIDQKGLLFTGHDEDGKDLYEMIESNKQTLKEKVKQFQLQKFISGVEVGASAFFNGDDFIYPILIAFEHKKLFPGDIGPITGEMGTSMFWSEPNYLFKATLEKMKDRLKASGYVGYIDINCIVNGKGIYPLEFTCRFGYPTISIQMEGILSPMGEFMYALAHHEPYKLKTKNGFQVGVVCALPPFPYTDKSETELYKDLSILFKKQDREGMRLGEVKMKDGVWRVAGKSGYVLVVTGSGTTMNDARKQAYNRIDGIILQNMFYRTDIGATWGEDSDKLRTWGYI